MAKVGRNERCPCGSGKKYKQCCLRTVEAEIPFDRDQRANAFVALVAFADEHLVEERLAAARDLWGSLRDRAPELDTRQCGFADELGDAWFWFDRPMRDGRLVVDAFLASGHGLGRAEQTWLTRMRDTCMRQYEVLDARPGISITLLDVHAGTTVSVSERTASRTARRGDVLLARVIRAGVSGGPELELSVVDVSPLLDRSLRPQLVDRLADFRSGSPGSTDSTFWKACVPFLHQAVVEAVLDPIVPTLQNTDGESLVLTRVLHEIVDEGRLKTALDGADALEPDGDGGWCWAEANVRGEVVTIASIGMEGDRLVVETNSVERGERARRLVSALAGDAVRFLLASHEDPTEAIRENLRSGEGPPPGAEPDLPLEVVERLTLDHHARHYRAWLDEPVPALGGATPRSAASRDDLRPKLEALLRGIEGQYQQALRRGEPAFDPSWMWEDLGLPPTPLDHPPPLAHERLAAAFTGLDEATRSVAARVRERPGFDGRTTRVQARDADDDLAVRRLTRDHPAAAALIPWLADFELHHRKTFWVDRGLAWQLARTDLDADGDDLRLPFASFALVFTDRLALSLAERAVASLRPRSPVAGHFARVLTVFAAAGDQTLELRLAVDTLGEDPPEVIDHVVRLDQPLPRLAPDTTPPPLPGLVHLVASAILYATAPGVQPVARAAPSVRAGMPRGRSPAVSSEQVWYLPGTIDISRLRELESLERAPGGGPAMHRYLVRGHWRRPNPTWKDKALRWIEPYWKGPPVGPIVEKAYRLLP